MIGFRTIAAIAIIIAFGAGFSAVVEAADHARVERAVNHEMRLLG